MIGLCDSTGRGQLRSIPLQGALEFVDFPPLTHTSVVATGCVVHPGPQNVCFTNWRLCLVACFILPTGASGSSTTIHAVDNCGLMWLTKKQSKLDPACSFVFACHKSNTNSLNQEGGHYQHTGWSGNNLPLDPMVYHHLPPFQPGSIHPHCNVEMTHDDPCSGFVPAGQSHATSQLSGYCCHAYHCL